MIQISYKHIIIPKNECNDYAWELQTNKEIKISLNCPVHIQKTANFLLKDIYQDSVRTSRESVNIEKMLKVISCQQSTNKYRAITSDRYNKREKTMSIGKDIQKFKLRKFLVYTQVLSVKITILWGSAKLSPNP